MATAQVIVTYEFEVEDNNYEAMYAEVISTPWTLDDAIQADVHIYDNEWNEVNDE